MSTPTISIIITSYKNPDFLRRCVLSVQTSLSHIEEEGEIIVSDGETGEDVEMLFREEFTNVTLLSHKDNIGFGALVNDGIGKARGEYIFILNGDILLGKDTLQKLFTFYKNTGFQGILGPKLLNFDETLQNSCFRFYKPLTILYRRTFLGKTAFGKKHIEKFLMTDYDRKEPREVDWLMGSALFTSKKCLNTVGIFDSRFFMYMEDVDLCRRFWENNYTVLYFPNAQAHHFHGKGSARGGFWRSVLANKLTWIHISSALKYFWKYKGKKNPRLE